MSLDYSNIKNVILDTFYYEEATIFNVENYLKHHNIRLKRNEVKFYISELLKEGFIKFYDDPTNGEIKFENSSDNYIEDYWFVLTEKGLKELKPLKD